MKLLKRMLLIGFITCLTLTGCGKQVGEETTSTTISKAPLASSVAEEIKSEVQETSDKELEKWNPAIMQRQMLFDEGYVAGVLFLGYVDAGAGDLDDDRDYYQSSRNRAI